MDNFLKDIVKIKPKDNIPFKCVGCGECCRNIYQQVPIEGLDAFRMTKYLQKQDNSITCVDDFLERYCEPVLLGECGYFVYFLKTKGTDNACVFLENNRCTIHACNPRACRTYPFIAAPCGEGESFEWLISYERKHHFNGPKVHTKTWMKKRFTAEDEAFLRTDLGNAKEISRLLKRIPEKDKVRALIVFQQMKYGDYELDFPFQMQYERNTQLLLEFLRGLISDNESV